MARTDETHTDTEYKKPTEEERAEIRREKARLRAAAYREAKRAANPPPPKPAPYDPQRLYEIHHRYYLKNRERFCEYARQARIKAKLAASVGRDPPSDSPSDPSSD